MGMTTMKDVMATLAPMMQGAVPFEVRSVQESAARIMAHSGENMTRLFPAGSLQSASFAKPEIWEDWEDFEALSEQLRTYALGLAMAAPNGLATPIPAATAPDDGAIDHSMMQMETVAESPAAEGGMAGHDMMQMGPSTEAETSKTSTTTYTVAELMGVTRLASRSQAASSASVEAAIDFSLMAADDAFEMVSQTCSSCHARFRTGS